MHYVFLRTKYRAEISTGGKHEVQVKYKQFATISVPFCSTWI